MEHEGGIYTARLGGNDFDMGQVEHYLKAMAVGTAEGVNEATQRDIDELGVEKALDRAQNERAETAAGRSGRGPPSSLGRRPPSSPLSRNVD